MPRSRRADQMRRRLQFEQFEQRLVMSGQAVAPAIVDLLPEMELAAPSITGQDVVWQGSDTLEDVAQRAADLAAQYGLDGSGQTIAVIDSGIAWDHHALGGGFGEGHQVVGGWDFAEDDALPYDDGPAGYHGTHVAGIIGSQDAEFGGISRGADLVALRVFDDQGAGDLDAVESALRWVHENQHQFRFPITTVNVSLGTGWDPESTAGWGQLDDEFAQLKADGIFISVATGNGYLKLGQPGLSYPAASPHVVPVASHGIDGQLSDFAQRDSGILVAPGELLRSTVPDHLFGGTQSDQLLASSGTSMASPYVAGASALMRQAYEFMGQESIDQDLIYQQFKATADRLYDVASGMTFDRLNLAAALQSVIADHHASNLLDATDLGVLHSGDSIEGTIGRLQDVDAFRWTAQETGRLTLRVETTHELALLVEASQGGWQQGGNTIYRDVQAGATYQLRLATGQGTGHYQLHADYQSAPAATDLGVVFDRDLPGQSVPGQQWYRMTAGRNGTFTVQTNPAQPGQLELQVVDREGRVLASSQATQGQQRLDFEVQAGHHYWLRVAGGASSQSFDLRLTNLVTLQDGQLTVHGTSDANRFQVTQGSQLTTTVDGTDYQWDLAKVDRVRVIGHGGDNQLALQLDDLNDRVVTGPHGLYATNAALSLSAFGIQHQTVDGGGGWDSVTMRDSIGADRFDSFTSQGLRWGRMAGSTYRSLVSNVELIVAESGQGHDQATLIGSSSDDRFVSRGNRQLLHDGSFHIVTVGFDNVSAYGGGGQDLANLFGSGSGDQFRLRPDQASQTTEHQSISVHGFRRVNAIGQGDDQAMLTDSIHRDTIDHRGGVTTIRGTQYQIYASGMAATEITSVGGWDLAQVQDTAADDRLWAGNGWAHFQLASRIVTLHGVENIGWTTSAGGQDVAQLSGGEGADQLVATAGDIYLKNVHSQVTRVSGAETVLVDLGQGRDRAWLTGTEQRDRFTWRGAYAELQSAEQRLAINNVQDIDFSGGGGRDSARIDAPLNLLEGLGDQARLVHAQNTARLRDIAFLQARNVDEAMAEYDLNQVDFSYLLQGNWLQR